MLASLYENKQQEFLRLKSLSGSLIPTEVKWVYKIFTKEAFTSFHGKEIAVKTAQIPVSFFNGISTIMGYLIPKPFLEKTSTGTI